MKLLKSILVTIMVLSIVNMDAGSTLNGTLDFYGHPLSITYDQQLANVSFYKLNQSEFDSKVRLHRNSNLRHNTHQLHRHIVNYNLDDAAITLLVDKYASRITGSSNSNTQKFVKYLVLKDLGYDVILTKTGNKLNCLGNLAFTPGRYIYIRYNNRVYKDLDYTNRKNDGKHLIFRDNKITKKNIRRNVFSVPKINARKKRKTLHFNFGIEKHSIDAESNESITQFLADLPLFEVGTEFTNIGVSDEMNKSTIDYLKDQVRDRETVASVKFLLSFVQQIVPYGSDFDKYGEERFYYPEETIMASTADCEDKAMLMAYLTKEVLGLNSVGLYFGNDEHLSLGIEIPNYIASETFGYNGTRYVSCEPTAKSPVLSQSQFKLTRVTEVIHL